MNCDISAKATIISYRMQHALTVFPKQPLCLLLMSLPCRNGCLPISDLTHAIYEPSRSQNSPCPRGYFQWILYDH